MADASHVASAVRFDTVDPIVILGVVAAAAVFAIFAGKSSSIRDYFLARRNLPWPAVALSLAASETSALAFVAIPNWVYRPEGNLAILQTLLISSVLARIGVAWLVVPKLYEREVFSPYAFVGLELGVRAQRLSSALFASGALLAHVARLYLGATFLQWMLRSELAQIELRTGVPAIALVIGAIALVATVWTSLGGVGAVVWADVVLYCAIAFGMLTALFAVVHSLDLGWERLFQVGIDSHKAAFFDFDTSPARTHTFWAALIASTWGGVGAYGVDQQYAQRLLCCKNVRSARAAIVASSIGVLVAAGLALVGIGLFALYEREFLTPDMLALYKKNGEFIFPIFFDHHMGAQARGWVVAGMLAAALGSFGALIAALGETVVANLYLPWRARRPALVESDQARRTLRVARMSVLAAGVLVGALAFAMQRVDVRYGAALDLGLQITSYTQGALIAAFALAALRFPIDDSGWLWSAPLAVMAVFGSAWHGPRSHALCAGFAGLYLLAWLLLRVLPQLRERSARAALARQTIAIALALALLVWVNRNGWIGVVARPSGAPEYDWLPLAPAWYVPVGSAVAFVFGCLLWRAGARRAGAHTTAAAS